MMRFSIRHRLILIVAIAVATLSATEPVHAAAPAWLSGMFKSKKAKSAQPPVLTSAEFSADPVSRVTAEAEASVNAAVAEANAVGAAVSVRPSQMALPISVGNQSNDQYLANLLHKAQANPEAKTKFAAKFPQLSSDFRRRRSADPGVQATDASGMAQWLANGTATAAPVVTSRPAFASNLPAPSADVAKVASTADHIGEMAAGADWAGASAEPSSVTMAQAVVASDPEPVVPEEYRNVTIPGLPADARIMSVEDRLVSPAVVPDGATLMDETSSTPTPPVTTTAPSPAKVAAQITTPSPVVERKMSTYTISPNAPPTVSTPVAPAAQVITVPAAPAPQATITIPADGRTLVHLTPQQIKQLPIGTRLIPANTAAMATLQQTAGYQPQAQPPIRPQPQTQQVAAKPSAAPAPQGPTQSSLVQQRLNQAFELCDEQPAMAEAQFVEILRYIAKAHDEAEGLDSYATSLERGLTTMHEAEQVQTALETLGEDEAVELAHSLQSDVSQSYADGKISSDEVVDAYHLYARHSLMIAVGEQPLGSQALYGWGQLCNKRANEPTYDEVVERGKAEALLTASLDADKRNWRAHNEMGILYARRGDYEKSEKSLRRSLALQPRSETYNNIAKVLDKQGKKSLASHARSRSEDAYASKDLPESAQVGAEQPLPESSRRDKVRAFVDRLMGNDQPKEYEDDDGIPLSAD